MVNSGEVLLKAVMFVEPKLLIGSDQNGTWPVARTQRFPVTDDVPPAERHDLNPATSIKENEVSPQSSDRKYHCGRTVTRKCHPGGLRVKDEGASECRSVMERIEGKPVPPATCLPAKEDRDVSTHLNRLHELRPPFSRQTSLKCAITREPWPTDLDFLGQTIRRYGTTWSYSTSIATVRFTKAKLLTIRAASRERRPRMPEPNDGKLSRSVPRKREAGNSLLLPGQL